MKLYKSIIAVAALAFLSGCNGSKEFTLHGTIEGLKEGKRISLVKLDFDHPESAINLYSGESNQGGFTIKGSVPDSLVICQLVIEGAAPQRYPIIALEKGEISIVGEISTLRDASIQGGKLNEQLSEMFQPFIAAEKNYEVFNTLLGKIPAGDTAELLMVKEKLGIAMEKLENAVFEVPQANINSPLSPFVILYSTRMQREEFVPLFNSFSDEVKLSPYGKQLARRLPLDFRGQQLTDFTLKNRNNQPLGVKGQLGELTLIDFWASWCPPCRRSIPHLKELYGKYYDKGFNIYSISVDKEFEKWVQALDEEHMEWPNVRDEQGDEAIAKFYQVQFIPHVLLVDNTAKIIAINPSKEELEVLLDKYLGTITE